MFGGPYPWSFYRGQWTPLPPAPKGDYLKGKIVVITGATSGIGLEATKEFAKASPEQLILAVRSTDAGEKLLNEIRKLNPKVQGKVMYLDLTELQSVKDFSAAVKEFGRIDLLINNAGINPNFDEGPYVVTKDGYERTFQTNVLSTFLTTALLLPLLKQSSEPKVIFTGSDVHHIAPSDLIEGAIAIGQGIINAYNDESKYRNPTRYYESKQLLQMLSRTLIKRLPTITIINTNPGLAMTNLGREFNIGFSPRAIGGIIWFLLFARSAGKAARCLTTTAAWQGGSQDYWSEGVPAASENTYLYSGKGIRATQLFYDEMLKELEKISPECTTEL
ncbi:hypothetical protein I302_104115 [Kwoniella bestiolae CBS 10118]|uniref:NAD(P)-binding protein n=1 Tax=Kwoniella bestiolae CBS 10118 TaxID=1296100 RepID=A0A1B9GAD1_9TREE|nr:hypothetical protein I302_02823 [Kwoniella bestiolae CBS 10118]OCF27973.1 hypothetical protein I302_02823 [Kwoniella bestiolae CBS 10118]